MLSAIEKLEKAKADILAEIDLQSTSSFVGNETSQETDNKNFQDTRIIINKLAKERAMNAPSFIKDCRNIEEAVYNIQQEGGSIDEILHKNYVSRCFNQYIDYLEEKQIDVQIVNVECPVPEVLTFEHILESISKCESRIETGDYSGAVTSAKTLVEGVCKEILHKFSDEEISNSIDLPALFTKVRQNLNLDPKDPKLDKALKDVLTGLIKVVNGISEIRNSRGDSHIPKYKIDKHHAVVVVNSAKTVADFLFKTYEYQLDRGTLVIEK